MNSYRLSVNASLLFSIEAGSQKEAKTIAAKVLDGICEGFDVDISGTRYPRVYVDDDAKIEVINIEEDEDAIQS